MKETKSHIPATKSQPQPSKSHIPAPISVLITGGAGFIGSNFIHYMFKAHPDYEIINLDKLTYAGNLGNLKGASNKPNYHFVKGDITNRELVGYIFEKFSPCYVVNFAAESHVDRSIENPKIFLETNVIGTQVLLDVAKKHWLTNGKWKEGVKFIQISTDEVYGSLGPTGFFTEETPLNPHSPYSASKASADFITKAYFDTFGMPVNITRCSNNYGPYQFPEKLIPLMINNALNHKELPVYGDGKQIRDWLYVEDHCLAIDLIIEKGENGEVYNIGGHNERTNLQIVNRICSILDKIYPISKNSTFNIQHSKLKSYKELISFVSDRPGHDRRYAIDSMKIQKELDWQPLVDFDEGMKKTIEWYLNNREWMNRITSGEYMKYYERMYLKRQDEQSTK
jgi:dTDP-glucose 4,6-dehydratase